MSNAPNLPNGNISLAISPVWSAEVLTLGGWGASFVAGKGVSQGAQYSLITDYSIKIIFGILVSYRVFSLTKPYWALWVP